MMIRHLIPAIFLSTISTAYSDTWYVSTNGSDAADGITWVTAKRTIQAAVDVSSDGDTVLVSNGVYSTGGRPAIGLTATNRVAIDKPITVRSVNGPSNTVIRVQKGVDIYHLGRLAVRCAYVTTNATLIGFSLIDGAVATNGTDKWIGGGVYGGSSNAVVANCIIASNAAIFGAGAFGGMYSNCTFMYNRVDYSSGFEPGGGGANYATLLTCYIVSNYSRTYGGGASYCTVSGSLVESNFALVGAGLYKCLASDCTITANFSDFQGGGTGEGTNRNCVIQRNIADNGGGAYTGSHFNCLITDNIAQRDGGGTYSSTIYNCTISHNTAGRWCAGMYLGNAYNCIVVSNLLTNGTTHNYSNATLIASCTTPIPTNGMGNIANDPQFVNSGMSNHRLSAASACVDKGSNIFVQEATDLDHGPRIVNGQVDIGAFEFREQATIPTVAEGNAYFNWHVVTGCVYRFEYTENMATSLWRSISVVTTAQASFVSILDTNNLDHGFFRCVCIAP